MNIPADPAIAAGAGYFALFCVAAALIAWQHEKQGNAIGENKTQAVLDEQLAWERKEEALRACSYLKNEIERLSIEAATSGTAEQLLHARQAEYAEARKAAEQAISNYQQARLHKLATQNSTVR